MEAQDPFQKLDAVLKNTSILHFPTRALATFGNTVLHYHIVSPLDERSARLREGIATVERPAILTAQNLKHRFEGFGDTAEKLGEWLLETFGESLKGLEYRFKNELQSTRVEHQPAQASLDRIKSSLTEENLPLVSLMASPDQGWQLALLKFVLDMTVKSFRVNVRELEERSLFDPPEEIALRGRHREVRQLLSAARQNPSLLKTLAEKLKTYGLFEEYEDAFFRLVKPSH